jgi:hypothetical protein
MKGLRIAIYHYAPLENFPPVQNMVNALASQMTEGDKVVIFTTLPNKTETLFRIRDKRITIVRTGKFSFGLSVFERYTAYLKFYLRSFFRSIRFRPSKLLYYESISSLAPVLYKKWIRGNVDVYIHYHEYMTPEEYNGMLLNRMLLSREKKIYPMAKWISHTNKDRLDMFCRDTGYFGGNNIHELPNYPPADWKVVKPGRDKDGILRMVYVGSFGSLETIYIREIIEWVARHSSKVSLDIFSNNISPEVQQWIDLEPRQGVCFRGNIPYYELPGVLPSYDVGLILYKGANENFIYNAPNKLFEYLVCGLEVWYPKEMLGIYPYDFDKANPRVLRCDFSQLGETLLTYANSRAGLPAREINFTFEDIAAPLLQKISDRETFFINEG